MSKRYFQKQKKLEEHNNFHFPRRSWTAFTFVGEARTLSLSSEKAGQHSLDLSQEKLDNFHAVKGECPEWFDNWDPNLPLAQVLFSLFKKENNPTFVCCFTVIQFVL